MSRSSSKPEFATQRQVAAAALRGTDPYVPFPVDLLPEPLRSFISDGAAALDCAAAYIALPLLSSLAAAIGNSRRIRLKSTWNEPAAVWTACVGESGTMKSPALEYALRFVRKRQDVAFRQHDDELQATEAERLLAQRELTRWQRSGSNQDAEPPSVAAPPVAERFVVADTTIEALVERLSEQPRGLLVARDELGGWLGGFGRYSNAGAGESAMWMEMV